MWACALAVPLAEEYTSVPVSEPSQALGDRSCISKPALDLTGFISAASKLDLSIDSWFIHRKRTLSFELLTRRNHYCTCWSEISFLSLIKAESIG